MTLQLLANLIVALLVGSSWYDHGSSHPSIRPMDYDSRSGPVRYYYSREAADYKEADEICKNNFGDGYGLAVLKNQTDQTDLETFLNRNGITPRTELWIGGSYYVGGKEFVWTNVRGADGKPAPFAPFAVALIEGYPSTYNTNDRTVFYQNDQFSSIIKIQTVTATRKFVCEYRQDRIVT